MKNLCRVCTQFYLAIIMVGYGRADSLVSLLSVYYFGVLRSRFLPSQLSRYLLPSAI